MAGGILIPAAEALAAADLVDLAVVDLAVVVPVEVGKIEFLYFERCKK